MEFKDMSKKQIEDMIKTEIKTLGHFLNRIDEETEYDIQAFAKICLFDENEMEFSSGSLHFGDPRVVRPIVMNDDWIRIDKEHEEIINFLDSIFNDEEEEE